MDEIERITDLGREIDELDSKIECLVHKRNELESDLALIEDRMPEEIAILNCFRDYDFDEEYLYDWHDY